ncbi:hypothetical protein [Salinimicrobium sp. WS361]|uniref:hypothetical protein n=1 Tax=Salinimicrobium sp. WS361 TaxID=3425123 RepID=UPI003D6DAEC1
MKKIYLLLILLTFLAACQDNLTKNKNLAEQEIISVLYDSLAKKIPPPPPNFQGMDKKDSLRILNQYTSIIDSLKAGKQIVGIIPNMQPLESRLDIMDFNFSKRELIHRLNSLQDQKPLNIAELRTLRSDSVVEFGEQHLREFSADYYQINKLLSFSRISFNEAGNEAAVIASVGTSRLASFTAIYFFRRISDKWTIVDSKGLSMS